MTLIDVVITALVALRSNILRTLLTMLGIIIGIAAVITLTAAGEGAQQGVADQIGGLGSNLMFVKPYSADSPGIALPGSGPGLFYEDAQAIGAAQIECIESIAPMSSVGAPGELIQATASYRGTSSKVELVGAEPQYEYTRDFYVANGRFISQDDVDKKALNVVLGSAVADELFGSQNPLGEGVRLFAGVGRFGASFNLNVIGVMEEKGGTALGSEDQRIFVPLPSLQARVALIRNPRGLTNVTQINIKLNDGGCENETKTDLAGIMRREHNLSSDDDDDFQISSQNDLLATATEVESTLQVLLVSIALISLVVGGIGIMNIMLVSVSERTREIGIRKAVGAKRTDILLQFLIEALVVTTIGGILGVLAGMGAVQIAEAFEIGGDDTQYLITPLWVGLGLVMSGATGLVFGVYPAWRAARLDPIEALRRE